MGKKRHYNLVPIHANITCVIMRALFIMLVCICTQSCDFIQTKFSTNMFDDFKVQADVNSTEKDKEFINNFNYAIALCDSLYACYEKKDTANISQYILSIRKTFRKCYGLGNHNDLLKMTFRQNETKVQEKLDELGVPREMHIPISVKDMASHYWNRSSVLQMENIYVDNGRMVKVIRRDDQKINVAKVKDGTRISEDGNIYTIKDDTSKKVAFFQEKQINFTSETKDPKVDLNDVFGSEDDDTDWNCTELEPDEYKDFQRTLDKMGIYYDSEDNCYRQKKN